MTQEHGLRKPNRIAHFCARIVGMWLIAKRHYDYPQVAWYLERLSCMKLLTFLDEAEYPLTTFVWEDRRYAGRFAPAASVRFLRPTELIVFLTEEAEQSVYQDFRSAFPADLPIRKVRIPAGSDQGQLEEIAQQVNQAVKDGDAIALDITHGPLCFPLIGLLATIFMVTTRTVSVKAILYAAYDVDRGVALHETPMFDLNLMLSWLRWFLACNRFISMGEADNLSALVKERQRNLARAARGDQAQLRQVGSLGKLAGVLGNIAGALHMIRPHQSMEHIADLQDRLLDALPLLEQEGVALSYAPLLAGTAESYATLALNDPLNPENGTARLIVERRLINWYVQRGLWIEAVTLGREWLVNWVMARLGLSQITNLHIRQRVESVLNAEMQDYLDARRTGSGYRSIFLRELPRLEQVLGLWSEITSVRNDINHAGMRDEPGKPGNLANRMRKCIQTINELPVEGDSTDEVP